MKFLVVGLGSMGKRRIRNLKRLNAGAIVGFDPRPDRRREVEQRYGIEVVADLDRSLGQSFLDAVVVSTPPDMHVEIARSALERGLHVFTEAGTSSEGMDALVALSKRRRLVAAPSCTMRFHPSVKKMHELVEGNAIGKVLAFTHHAGQYLPDWHPAEDYRKFYVSRRKTGACREIVPFELTWLNWLMGAQPELVTGLRGKVSTLDCDIDDLYHTLLRYPGGALCHLQVDAIAQPAVRATRLIGQTGTIEWVAAANAVRVYNAAAKTWTDYPEPEPMVEPGYSEMSPEGMYVDEMAAFAAACRGERPYPYSFDEDMRCLEVLYAAERAADGKSQVELPRA
ncbi:MAG: Gfo/Idh/MocA family oxidoreductase [Alphaproteobacteria bacterium]|nr:Gfo/Idh/MocA family oxidoreductase [Alphaproteobacteria bacterium]